MKRTQHIEIARSPGDVFAYLTDPSRLSTSAVGTRLTFTPIVRLTGSLVRIGGFSSDCGQRWP